MHHAHGDDAYRQAHPVRLDFSSNVWPTPAVATQTALQAHLAAELTRIDHYPEAMAETFTAELAAQLAVPAEAVWVCNGAADAIDRIALIWRERPAAIGRPTFAEYAEAARRHGQVVMDAGDGDAPDATPGALVWWCNPNNPTGTVTPRDEVLARVDAAPDGLFVVDQAYADFAAEPAVSAADAVVRPNLLLVRSMTKLHALPGLRLGYVVGAPVLVERLRERAVPWAVNRLALAAGRFLLGRSGPSADEMAQRRREARTLAGVLAQVRGITVRPSGTHYFLWRNNKAPAARLKADLVREHGILIRDAGNFDGLDAHWARVAARGEDDDQTLVEAVWRWML
ncbi:pyridoxal phosphate-dependent aminotransferase [Actomonas aquatica]|uniref:Aminotransferase n=1 Tax=Actomonas aquatica TaxID=2866162 RepID=A0ABZ1CDH9_9BACT|nr:aminotransferase class I/II-fold pyridoxal phosphate-dependent enzyme [Opitutus sp. WL0086]WRQ89725.1 aminotransferase class I/II-fold pyridoxal phosphate-dependent enzyme [Opitutus sp. WL0086]